MGVLTGFYENVNGYFYIIQVSQCINKVSIFKGVLCENFSCAEYAPSADYLKKNSFFQPDADCSPKNTVILLDYPTAPEALLHGGKIAYK